MLCVRFLWVCPSPALGGRGREGKASLVINRDKKTIETKTSMTAKYTCMSRAASSMEKRECYKGTDNISSILVPGIIKLLFRSSWICKLYGENIAPKGIYEYVIARTKYIDSVFRDALEKGFDQILIFGAGFDSRAQRFNHLNQSTMIFELDAPITQGEKKRAFDKKKIMIPERLVFVPINFNKEKLEEKLTQAGFEENRQSLFLLEGVTMYLSDTAIDSTFSFIRDVSGKGSLIVFDYVYAGVLRGENRYYGEKDIVSSVAKAGEAWTFALEEGETGDFLLKYGFTLKDHSNAKELEGNYFRNSEGKIAGKINGTHSLVTAIRK